MTNPRILVTSASGHTGQQTTLSLLKKGFPVRAFVRKEDYRSDKLKNAGAEIFVGNLFDFDDLIKAMKDVQRAYHCPPFADHLLQNTMLFALAAEQSKLEVVALLSQWNPHPTHPSNITREHWIANQLYRWMPSVDVVHINPGLFAFTYLLGLPAIHHFGMFMAPFGNGLNAPPSNEDIAEVAACVLADPQQHISKSFRPTGPELISPTEAADIMAHVMDRKVIYKAVDFPSFTKAAKALGFPDTDLAHLQYYANELRSGAFAIGGPTSHVEEVTQKKPDDFETIVSRYLQNPDLIYQGLKVGNKLDAMRFLFRMILTPKADLKRHEHNKAYPVLTHPKLAHQKAEWCDDAISHKLHLLAQPLS